MDIPQVMSRSLADGCIGLLGNYNKNIPERLEQQKLIVSQSWSLEVLNQGVRRARSFWGLWENLFQASLPPSGSMSTQVYPVQKILTYTKVMEMFSHVFYYIISSFVSHILASVHQELFECVMSEKNLILFSQMACQWAHPPQLIFCFPGGLRPGHPIPQHQ